MRKIENNISIIITSIFLLLNFFSFVEFNTSSINIESIRSNLFTVFSIFFGFLTTTLSILMTLPNENFIKKTKSSGALEEVYDSLLHAIFWCFGIIIALFIELFISSDCVYNNDHQIFNLILCFSIGSFVATIKSIYYIYKIFKMAIKSSHN